MTATLLRYLTIFLFLGGVLSISTYIEEVQEASAYSYDESTSTQQLPFDAEEGDTGEVSDIEELEDAVPHNDLQPAFDEESLKAFRLSLLPYKSPFLELELRPPRV